MKIHPNGVAFIEGDTHHAVWCAHEGLVHDKFMAGFIRDFMRGRDCKVVVDAGANIGTLTQVFLEEGARVHAFEPNPEAVECLRWNCPKATVYQGGLSDKTGIMHFAACKNAGASYLSTEPTGLQVSVSPLDMYGGIQPRLIKLDIEGYEVAALRGAKSIIQRYKPAIIAEVNQDALARAGESEASLMALLLEYGYTAKIIQSDCKWGDPQFDILALA